MFRNRKGSKHAKSTATNTHDVLTAVLHLSEIVGRDAHLKMHKRISNASLQALANARAWGNAAGTPLFGGGIRGRIDWSGGFLASNVAVLFVGRGDVSVGSGGPCWTCIARIEKVGSRMCGERRSESRGGARAILCGG